MTQNQVAAEAIDFLKSSFSGPVVLPGDDNYDSVRQLHNGLIDKRPAVIARCRGVADIADAVNFARDNSLEIAVRGGAHNVAGRASTDGGIMIDLSLMRGVHVDPKTGVARAQGGATWGDFNRETQTFGLATTGGLVSTTGIAGLTLGGGHGWIMGKYGMTVDNLLAVEIVTADGKVIKASADEHPDLFWAVRGGGGNFGVVSWFEYKLHEVGQITGGLVAHPFDAAKDVWQFYREFTASVPDELTVHTGLLHGEDGSKIVALLACHCGSLEDGAKAVAPIKQFGSPAADTIGPMSYNALNTMLDGGFPKGALNYWKSSFIREFSDDVIDTAIKAFEACPSPMSGLLLEHFHGATARVGATDTAFPHRETGYNFLAFSEWMDTADNDKNIAWARDTHAAMQPLLVDGLYVNYLPDDAGQDLVAAAYGPTYQRLSEVKKQYDPDNLFHMNQNIKPA